MQNQSLNMAHDISNPECKKEYFDSETDFDAKLDLLTQWIKESRHLIVFTGISSCF